MIAPKSVCNHELQVAARAADVQGGLSRGRSPRLLRRDDAHPVPAAHHHHLRRILPDPRAAQDEAQAEEEPGTDTITITINNNFLSTTTLDSEPELPCISLTKHLISVGDLADVL